MKTLKISLLLALFVIASSQIGKTSNKMSVDIHENTIAHVDNMAGHEKNKIKIPTQG